MNSTVAAKRTRRPMNSTVAAKRKGVSVFARDFKKSTPFKDYLAFKSPKPKNFFEAQKAVSGPNRVPRVLGLHRLRRRDAH